MTEHKETVEINTESSDAKLADRCTCSEDEKRMSEFTAKKWFYDL